MGWSEEHMSLRQVLGEQSDKGVINWGEGKGDGNLVT